MKKDCMERYFNIRYEFDPQVVHERIAQQVAEQGAGYICVADANILQQVHNDLSYREVVDGSMFAISDSSWVPVFLRWIYGIDRKPYCGSMIFKDIIEMKRYRHFFMGTSTITICRFSAVLASRRHTNILKSASISAYGFSARRRSSYL